MNLSNKTLNELISKDKIVSKRAAKAMIDNIDIESFEILNEKFELLFPFIRKNIIETLKNSCYVDNYKNILPFLTVYNVEFEDFIIPVLTKYANEELSDELLDILKTGSDEQKAYCAAYFSCIRDSAATELLEENAFSSYEPLMYNTIYALRALESTKSFKEALVKLNSNDEFEVVEGVKFLALWGDLGVVDKLFETMYASPFSENIASEIPYLFPLIENLDDERVLDCLDLIINSLGEIVPLGSIFDYGFYPLLEELCSLPLNSHNAKILLKAKQKFTLFSENSQYTYDEVKDVKEEIKIIAEFLNGKNASFWIARVDILPEELTKSDFRILSALNFLRENGLSKFATDVTELLKSENEIVLAEAIYTLSTFERLDLVENGDLILQRIKNKNIEGIIRNLLGA